MEANTIHLDIIERYLKEKPGSNSLTLFRFVYQNDSEADQMHRLWIHGKVVPLQVHGFCEASLNDQALEQVRQSDRFAHLTGAFK